MQIRFLAFFLVLSLFLASCESKSVNLLDNGDFSDGLTNSWWNHNGNSDEYNVELIKDVLSPQANSIKISADSTYGSFAHWAQVVSENIPNGKRVRLKLKIKLDDVAGKGISIAVRCDDTHRPEGKAEMFSTTQGRLLISGTSDWKEYEISSDIITEDIKSVTIYLLMLDRTIGTAYFDDVVLEQI